MPIPEKPNNQGNAEFSASAQRQQFNRGSAEERKPAETQQTSGLLNKEMVGVQALLLTGIRPQEHTKITNFRINETKVNAWINGDEAPSAKTLTKASHNERVAYWQGRNTPQHEKSRSQQVAVWETGVNQTIRLRYS